MFEDEYRALFNKFSKDLHELTKKRSESLSDMSFDYIFYVRDKNGVPTNWASGTHDGYLGGDLIEGIIHQIIIDDFHDLGLTEVSKEEYLEQVNDLIGELLSAGNMHLENMPYDFEIPERTY